MADLDFQTSQTDKERTLKGFIEHGEPLTREAATILQEKLSHYIELEYLHKTILPTILSFLVHEYSFVWIKTLTDKTFTVKWLKETDTIGRMAERIEDQEGIKKESQRFIFAGKRLEWGKKHEEYGIYTGCTIHMVLRLIGGATGAASGNFNDSHDVALPQFEVICVRKPTLSLPVDLQLEIPNQVYKQPLYFPDTLCTMLHHIASEFGDFDELPLTGFSNGKEVLENWVHTLRPGLSQHFDNLFDYDDDLMIEGFFIRETKQTLNIIKEHKDSSDLTLQMCLSLEGVAGGMKFAADGSKYVRVRHQVGQLLTWRGRVKHEVLPTQGERLSLLAFVSKRT